MLQRSILFFCFASKKYGGGVYESILSRLLRDHYGGRIEVAVRGENKLTKLLYLFISILKLRFGSKYQVCIRSFHLCFFFRKDVKNIVILHHYDPTAGRLLVRLHNRICFWFLCKNQKRIHTVIVVGKYWEKEMQKLGFNTHTIYNSFDINKYKVTDYEVSSLKKKYSLSNKPIAYVGNSSKDKGIIQTRDALADLDAQLVSTGVLNQTVAGVKNLGFISYKEYIILLAASDIVITMSTFAEGWCRTAHEAMLVKTPVVGSGAGGMQELLEGGEQKIADFNSLQTHAKSMISNPRHRAEAGEKGYKYASGYTLHRFETELKTLMTRFV